MKKAETNEMPDGGALRPEYDFSKGRRGVTARRYAQGVIVHKLDSDPRPQGNQGAVVVIPKVFAPVPAPRGEDSVCLLQF